MRANKSYSILPAALIVLLILALLLSIRYGAVSIDIADMLSAVRKSIAGDGGMNLYERIFMQLRLPRALLCVLVGASLAVGGTLMQALFRNPIVEPGLIGTSSGAAFGAALHFVLGATFQFNSMGWALPIMACAGGICSTMLVFVLSRSWDTGKSSVVSMLLTGIAVNALFMSGVGFLSYIARDPQARSITFWGMGNLSGANWNTVKVVAVSTLVCIIASIRYARHLNALMLGEEEAQYLGVNVRRLKLTVVLINVVMVAVATAFVGVISFVGLIVPHLLRMMRGADNRFLIPNSAVLGGIVLSVADVVSRMVLRPAELPIGIVTALLGVPVFIILLRRKNYIF
jgi:iron complex transport system permease protein